MGIKEKELENLVLNLLDTSPAIQRKIRGICSVNQDSTVMSASNMSLSADSKAGFLDERKISNLKSTNEQLRSQLSQCQSEYKQANSEKQKWENAYEQLQSKCNSLETDKSSLESKVSRLESDLKKAKAEQETSKQRFRKLELENNRLNDAEHSLASKLEDLKQRFSDPVRLLDRYKSLSASIRTGLSDVICDKDEVLFIASCSTSEHLKAIWTYTKKLSGSNGDANSIDILKEIFDYFFDVFNSSLREPMYVRDSVEVGYSFDDEKYDRCAGSSTSGKITQVILKGYKSVNTGAIICRSLVRV